MYGYGAVTSRLLVMGTFCVRRSPPCDRANVGVGSSLFRDLCVVMHMHKGISSGPQRSAPGLDILQAQAPLKGLT